MVKSEGWVPKVGEFTWTRFDKSNARALGIILRLPLNPPTNTTGPTPSVYCELDMPDRFAIACLDGESHVYPPAYYLKPFMKEAALALRCMKVKSSKELSLWDREKRKSIKSVIRFLENNESLVDSHDFVKCPECCDEADQLFWEKMQLTRGEAHIRRKESLETRRQKTREEVEERDRLYKEREQAARVKAQRSIKKEESSAERGSSEEESTDGFTSDSEEDDDDDDSVESEVAVSESDSESVVVDEEKPRKVTKKTRTKHRRPNLDSSSSETEKESNEDEPAAKKRRKS